MAKARANWWEHPRNQAFGGIAYGHDWRKIAPLPGVSGTSKRKKSSESEEEEGSSSSSSTAQGWPAPRYPGGLPEAEAESEPGWGAPQRQQWGQPVPTGPTNAFGTPHPQPSAMYQHPLMENGGATGLNGSYGVDRSKIDKRDITTSPGWQRLRQDRERSA